MILVRLAKFVTAGVLALVPFAIMPLAAVADPNVAVLAFGLVGSQSVFESEAKAAAAILAQRLGAGNVVARANTKTRGDVTIAAINADIGAAAAGMDREHDVLALILTSHGSPDGVAVQTGRRVEILSPPALAALLAGAGVRPPHRHHFCLLLRGFSQTSCQRRLVGNYRSRFRTFVIRLPGQGEVDLFRRCVLQYSTAPHGRPQRGFQ
jgi:hypothetical protein